MQEAEEGVDDSLVSDGEQAGGGQVGLAAGSLYLPQQQLNLRTTFPSWMKLHYPQENLYISPILAQECGSRSTREICSQPL